jgi:hypothetical protein
VDSSVGAGLFRRRKPSARCLLRNDNVGSVGSRHGPDTVRTGLGRLIPDCGGSFWNPRRRTRRCWMDVGETAGGGPDGIRRMHAVLGREDAAGEGTVSEFFGWAGIKAARRGPPGHIIHLIAIRNRAPRLDGGQPSGQARPTNRIHETARKQPRPPVEVVPEPCSEIRYEESARPLSNLAVRTGLSDREPLNEDTVSSSAKTALELCRVDSSVAPENLS